MVINKPFNLLSSFPFKFKFFSKLVLGLALLSFFLNYQPSFKFPPQKVKVAQAQNTQTQEVKAENLGFKFQQPHPGYLSTHFSNYHPGIDIATGLGMPIKPIAPGKVVGAYYNFWGLGLTVEVEHSSGYKSLYAHLGKIYVQNGKELGENDFLGEVGMTGNTSGPHTHLEVFKESQYINPIAVLPELRNFPEESDYIAHGGNRNIPNLVPIPQPTFVPTPAPKAEEVKTPTINLNEILKPHQEKSPTQSVSASLVNQLPL